MNNKLTEIVTFKLNEVEARKKAVPFDEVIERMAAMPEPYDLAEALSNHESDNILCIAEIKKASPSKGIISKDFAPDKIAREYMLGGAAALSVLTDERYFKGHPDYVAVAKHHSHLPVLRKDFIVDEYQIFESRMIGADAILLIVSVLSDRQLRSYITAAADISLSVLAECHSKEEIERALHAGAKIVGINNRNLQTFATDVGLSMKLKRFIPNDCVSVSESGIHNYHTVEQLAQTGFDAVLVGEHLMIQQDKTKAVRELMGKKEKT